MIYRFPYIKKVLSNTNIRAFQINFTEKMISKNTTNNQIKIQKNMGFYAKKCFSNFDLTRAFKITFFKMFFHQLALDKFKSQKKLM